MAPASVYRSSPGPVPPPEDPAARLWPARCSVMEHRSPEDKALTVCFLQAQC